MADPRVSDTQRRRIFGAPGRTDLHVVVLTPWGIKVRAHRLVAARFLSACELAKRTSGWSPKRIDSYANRTVRGSTTVSLHAYALAFDFFDRPLPEPVDVWGPKNAPPPEFRNAFKTLGFVAGADFSSRSDYPHIEWAAGIPSLQPVTPVVFDPAPAPEVPMVKPITYTRLGEATGVRVSTHFVSIPALDKEGRGWADLPVPIERVLSVTAQGSDPPKEGYWHPVILTMQPREGATRVTLAGKPSQATGFFWHCLEEQ